jgi:hypothetical protein
MINIQKIRRYLAKQSCILAGYLFGSQANEKARPNSDVDVAILVNNRQRMDHLELEIRFRSDLEKLMKKEVDVVIMNHADPFLKQQIYSNGKCIFSRNRKEHEGLKWRHVREYWDFIPLKRIMDDTALQTFGYRRNG